MVKKGRENKLGVVGYPGGARGKEFACNAGDTGNVGSIPGSGRSPGGGHGNPLQYPCLENPMDRGAWRATVHSVAKSQTQLKGSSMHACIGQYERLDHLHLPVFSSLLREGK